MIIPMLLRELSIDASVNPEKGTRLETFIADPNSADPVRQIQQVEVRKVMEQALFVLDERERHIIRSRFGLFDDVERTLEEIGKSLRLSRERVRQLESKAMTKLRARLNGQRAYLV